MELDVFSSFFEEPPWSCPGWVRYGGSWSMQMSSTWAVVCLDPGVWRAWLPQHPHLYPSSTPAHAVCILSVCGPSCCTLLCKLYYAHTHPPNLCSKGQLHVQPWFLQIQSWAGLCPCPGEVKGAVCMGQSRRRAPQGAARPFLARCQGSDAAALGVSQGSPACTPCPHVCLYPGHCLSSS